LIETRESGLASQGNFLFAETHAARRRRALMTADGGEE